jgi:hypothetical protein
MAAEPPKDISKILADPNVAVEVVREGVRDAIRRHKQMGLPLAVWKDGQVVWITAEEAEAAMASEPPAPP